jgi:hypothetical protein
LYKNIAAWSFIAQKEKEVERLSQPLLSGA